MAQPLETLITRAKKADVRDAYEFAEWLVQCEDHFGDCNRMSESDMEAAYEQAMHWWNSHHGVRV